MLNHHVGDTFGPDQTEAITFVAAETDAAQSALDRLTRRYGQARLPDARVVVALGGDGFLLSTLHRFLSLGKPVFGMNCGSVGFLMNDFDDGGLDLRLRSADTVTLHPLKMIATDANGIVHQARAFNEVSMFRQAPQAAKLRLLVDGKVRMETLTCDGILVATPAGSTAYNLSVAGPILPLGANLLALTPVSAFRPRRWRGALLPEMAEIAVEVLEADKRPVAAVADDTEIRHVQRIGARLDHTVSIDLLFDPHRNLHERIITEQFVP